MTWTIRLVLCFFAVNSCGKLCDGTRLEEFLHAKQSYLQEFDLMFDAFYLRRRPDHSVGGTNTNAQRQGLRSQPLPSPDWSTHSVSLEDVIGEEPDDYLDPALFEEEENYRPREEASRRDVRVDGLSEDVFSGDHGFFLTGKPGDDDEGYEDSGNGESQTETTTSPQTTLSLQETTTSVPDEADSVVYFECKDHLRAEIKSCVEFSFNLRTMLQEMETFVEQSGYYNGSSSYHFFQLFRTCASTIASPPSCLEGNADENVIMDVIDDIVTALSYSINDGSYVHTANTEHRHFDCFDTHLQFLQSCVGARLTNAQIETLVRIIVARAKDASMRECQDLEEVQQCVVGSMTKCEDSTSPRLVDEMFEATKGALKTCSVETTTRSVNKAAVKMSLGTVVTLLLSILALGSHKQMHN